MSIAEQVSIADGSANHTTEIKRAEQRGGVSGRMNEQPRGPPLVAYSAGSQASS